jgi:sphinganine C4-monooxygenase
MDSFLTLPPGGVWPPPPSKLLGLDSAVAPTVLPILFYWIASILYELATHFDFFNEYHVYPDGDEKRRNLVSRTEVLRNVLTMQAVQIAFGLFLTANFPSPIPVRHWNEFGSVEYFGLALVKLTSEGIDGRLLWFSAHSLHWVYLGLRQFCAFFVFDTWAYWVHYTEHMVPWLYRKSLLFLDEKISKNSFR